MSSLKQAREEGEGDHAFFLEVYLPDGTPAACGDVEHGKEEQEEK